MRIAFLIRDLQMGGAERQLVALACGLHRRGHNVTIVTYYNHAGPLTEHAITSGIALVTLGKQGRWDIIPFLYRLYRYLGDIRPDVIHGYLVTSNILVTMAGWVVPRAQVLWGVRASDLRLQSLDWSFRFSFFVSRLLSRCPDQIIANSEAGRNYHIQMGYPAQQVVVIPNGIDTDHFIQDIVGGQRLRESWGVASSETLVGMVARLDPMKDHGTFLRAARLMADTHQNAKFICIGDGPRQYRDELTALVASLGLRDAVIWGGERSDLPAVYSALDVATLTSVSEGFPNVVAEAMSCGIPVVATDAGDSAAVIGDSRAIVPPGDPAALKGAWEDALAAPRGSRREALRRQIVENFSLESLVSRTDGLITRIVVGS